MDNEYDEDTGIFTIREKYLFGLWHYKKTVMEKDLNINQINIMKEQAHKTTFTDDDIDVLYKFASLEFNFNKDRKTFREIPIKEIFNVSNDQLILNKLVPMAYNYTDKVMRGEKPIIQKTNNIVVQTCTQNNNSFYIRIFIFILLIIFLILLLYLCLTST